MAAQDAHYWTSQYGTRSELLGGLVVGTFRDLSATYYNPGAIALVNDPSLLLGSDAFGIVDINFSGLLGEGLDVASSRLRPAPSMVALQLPIKGLGRHRLALSVLTRHDFSFKGQARRIVDRDQLESGEADAAFAGEALLELGLSENWAGVSWAYRLGPRVGLGATTYLALRSQNIRTQVIAQTVDSIGEGSAAVAVDEINYSNVRLLWKVGIGVDLSPLTLGLTITTPGISFFGTGEVLENVSVINIDPDGGGEPVSELESDFQDGLDTNYKSPLSVAAGASYYFGETGLFLTAEWFDSVDEFSVMDAQEYVGQTTGDTISIDVTHKWDSVLNWGVGVEQGLGKAVHLYGAFFTDKSAMIEGEQAATALATWDIYHFTTGVALDLQAVDFSLGLSWGWGDDTLRQIVDLTGEELTERNVTYRSLKLIFGLSIGL